MLTARAEPEQRIEGLEAGVDDYVAKPFEPRELLLRLQNILRARPAARPGRSDEIRMGDYTFHVARGELKREEETDQAHRARARPAAPVRPAAGNADRPPRAGRATIPTGSERAIDVQINRLRRKIETDPANPVYLQTVRGKGYILHTD